MNLLCLSLSNDVWKWQSLFEKLIVETYSNKKQESKSIIWFKTSEK